MNGLLPSHQFTLDEQIDEVAREIDMRQRVYPNLVASRRMTSTQAEKRIEYMRASEYVIEPRVYWERAK